MSIIRTRIATRITSRITSRITMAATLATVGTLATVALAAPASAETANVLDGPDASGSLGDILTVNIKHRDRRVVVTTNVADLRRQSEGGPSGLNIWFDTDPGRRVRSTSSGPGSSPARTTSCLVRGTGEPSGSRSSCDHHATFDWAGDKVVLSVARRCLGRPAQIRVAERMRDDFDASHPIIDWMKGTRQFSRWVDHA